MCSLSSCSCRTDYSSAASYSRSMTQEVQNLILLPLPRAPLSPPPCSRPHTSKLLTRHTLSEFLTPVPPSLWTSSPVISLDCRAASHLFSLLSLSSLFLPSCSLATRHLPHPPPRLGTGVLPASLPPPLRLFTSWHHVLLLTCLLISVGLELRWSTVLFIGPVFNAGWNG